MLHITEYDERGELTALFNDLDRQVRPWLAEIEFRPVASSSPRAVWGKTKSGFALVTDDEADIPEARQAGPITDVPSAVRRHEIAYRAFRAMCRR